MPKPEKRKKRLLNKKLSKMGRTATGQEDGRPK